MFLVPISSPLNRNYALQRSLSSGFWGNFRKEAGCHSVVETRNGKEDVSASRYLTRYIICVPIATVETKELENDPHISDSIFLGEFSVLTLLRQRELILGASVGSSGRVRRRNS